MNKLLLLILVSLFTINIASAITNITNCGSVSIDGEYYTLINNISSAGSCLTVLANNVTIDGNWYWINYSQSLTGYAIDNSGGYDNITVKNLNIVQGSSTIFSDAVDIENSDNNNISDNKITVFGDGTNGIYIGSSDNNRFSNNTITTYGSISGHGISINSGDFNNVSRNNILISGEGNGIRFSISTSNNIFDNIISTLESASEGMAFYSSSNSNVLLNNTILTSNSDAIYFFDSGENVITNGSIISQLAYDYSMYMTYSNEVMNTFKNTNFTTRKILLSDSNSKFNYSNGSDIWLNTNTPWASPTVTTRNLLNWTQSNLSWSETWTVARQIQYDVSGLLPLTDYQIYNGTIIDYNITSDASGILTPFTINFTTTAKIIKILQVTTYSPNGTFNQDVYNTGWQAVFINSTQAMTSIRNMMNSSNVLWITKWNAATQKWQTYKAGWTYNSATTIDSGGAAYVKIQNNDTVTRNIGNGTYNWTLSSGWNLAGLDYAGTRTLSQINASVNTVCEVDKIVYIAPEARTEYTYTCGLTNNESIAVGQGEGVWMNLTTSSMNKIRNW